MTNTQLYLAIGVPVLFNLGLITFLYLTLSRQLEQSITGLRETMTARFEAAQQSLLRVEQVLDARLKHVEDAIERR